MILLFTCQDVFMYSKMTLITTPFHPLSQVQVEFMNVHILNVYTLEPLFY